MKRVVWKFHIEMLPMQRLEMPKEARILSFQTQGSQLAIWAEVNSEAEKETRTFFIIGTGQSEVDDAVMTYVGTAQIGSYVWHLYEANENPRWDPKAGKAV